MHGGLFFVIKCAQAVHTRTNILSILKKHGRYIKNRSYTFIIFIYLCHCNPRVEGNAEVRPLSVGALGAASTSVKRRLLTFTFVKS